MAIDDDPRTPPTMETTLAADVTPSCFADKNLVVLTDWWLIEVEKGLEGKKLGVSGFNTRKQVMQQFNSAAIVKRVDAYTLVTADGVTIIIQGVLNKARTSMNGFPSAVCSHFSMGFPYNWEYYCNNYFQNRSMVATVSDPNEPLELPAEKVGASYPANLDMSSVDRIICQLSPGGETPTECFKNDLERFLTSSSINPMLQSFSVMTDDLSGFNMVKNHENITKFATSAMRMDESLSTVKCSHYDAVDNSLPGQRKVQSQEGRGLQRGSPIATIGEIETRNNLITCIVNGSECDQVLMEEELTIEGCTGTVIKGNTVVASSSLKTLDVPHQEDNLKVTDAAKRRHHDGNEHADGKNITEKNDLHLAINLDSVQVVQRCVSSPGIQHSGCIHSSHLMTSEPWNSDDKSPNVIVEDSAEEPVPAEAITAVKQSEENVNIGKITENNLEESMVQSISQNDKSSADNHGECLRNCKTAQIVTASKCGSSTSNSSEKQLDSLIFDSELEMTHPLTSLGTEEEKQVEVCCRDNLVGPNEDSSNKQLKDKNANQPGSVRGQKPTADRKRTPRKNISKGVEYLDQYPLTRETAKSFGISSPSSMSLRKSRSGRVIVPALDIGCQQIVYDMEGSIVGIMNSPIKGRESEPTRKSAKPTRPT